MPTIDFDSDLTSAGKKAYMNEATKGDILRTFFLMHQFSSSANHLEVGDLFYGPRFKGDGLTPNIYKYTLNGWNCIFEPVAYNASNVQKVCKDIEIDDFGWFKAPTGDYYFACWASKSIQPLSIYWTNKGINALQTKLKKFQEMRKKPNLYTHSQIHRFCKVPFSNEYFG